MSHQSKRHFFTKKWVVRFFLIGIGAVITYTIWQMWDIDRFGRRDDGSSAECGVVLGAAAWHNKPSPVFRSRINHAISLYETGRIKVIILTGGFGEGADYAESEVAKRYCIEKGIPKKDIFIETLSQTTKENLSEANSIMQRQGYKSVLIISDPWHLKRACSIAKHYGMDAKPSATNSSLFTTKQSKLNFIWREFKHIHLWRFN